MSNFETPCPLTGNSSSAGSLNPVARDFQTDQNSRNRSKKIWRTEKWIRRRQQRRSRCRDRIRRKVNEVNSAAQSHLSPVQDHISFTLQKAYFKCAYECFNRTRTHAEISQCTENCSFPITNAQNHFENEMSMFQERLNRSLMVCQDNFEAAKLQKVKNEAVNDLEQCDNVKTLPHLVTRLRNALSVKD